MSDTPAMQAFMERAKRLNVPEREPRKMASDLNCRGFLPLDCDQHRVSQVLYATMCSGGESK